MQTARSSRLARIAAAAALTAALPLLTGCATEVVKKEESATRLEPSHEETSGTAGTAGTDGSAGTGAPQSADPQPAQPKPVRISGAVALTAADVSRADPGHRWRIEADGAGNGPAGAPPLRFDCQRSTLVALKPARSWHRDFAAGVETAGASQLIADFGTENRARAVAAKVNGWVSGCRTREDNPHFSPSGIRRTAGVTAAGGTGDAWLYTDYEAETGETTVTFVGVGRKGSVVTVTTLYGPAPVSRYGTPPSETMIRKALERLAR